MSPVKKMPRKRILVTIDVRLIEAMDKYLNKLQDSGVTHLNTKSQLIEEAICVYFSVAKQESDSLTKGVNKDENQ